jgi:hypothetical protein
MISTARGTDPANGTCVTRAASCTYMGLSHLAYLCSWFDASSILARSSDPLGNISTSVVMLRNCVPDKKDSSAQPDRMTTLKMHD